MVIVFWVSVVIAALSFMYGVVGLINPGALKDDKTGEIPKRSETLKIFCGFFVVFTVIALVSHPSDEKTTENKVVPDVVESKKVATSVQEMPSGDVNISSPPVLNKNYVDFMDSLNQHLKFQGSPYVLNLSLAKKEPSKDDDFFLLKYRFDIANAIALKIHKGDNLLSRITIGTTNDGSDEGAKLSLYLVVSVISTILDEKITDGNQKARQVIGHLVDEKCQERDGVEFILNGVNFFLTCPKSGGMVYLITKESSWIDKD
ncbi:hypothetical protein EA127_16215 [Salmonella enterica subsp. diarizonae serovar 48:i:z]|nr:hypothetical protein [Salmonella enterica subsp. diarizonae serovar 48:i:z]